MAQITHYKWTQGSTKPRISCLGKIPVDSKCYHCENSQTAIIWIALQKMYSFYETGIFISKIYNTYQEWTFQPFWVISQFHLRFGSKISDNNLVTCIKKMYEYNQSIFWKKNCSKTNNNVAKNKCFRSVKCDICVTFEYLKLSRECSAKIHCFPSPPSPFLSCQPLFRHIATLSQHCDYIPATPSLIDIHLDSTRTRFPPYDWHFRGHIPSKCHTSLTTHMFWEKRLIFMQSCNYRGYSISTSKIFI